MERCNRDVEGTALYLHEFLLLTRYYSGDQTEGIKVDGSRGAYDEKRDSPKDLVKEA
jgi:hypothetical protein